MFGIQFYPTPESLSMKMAAKVDWTKVNSMLEPSAGKGDIIDGIYKYLYQNELDKKQKKIEKLDLDRTITESEKKEILQKVKSKIKFIDCVEIDPNLAAILRDNNYSVNVADFLEWNTYTRYDLIAMNPPFSEGDKHLMKALNLCRTGGQIVCILNAETIKNPYSILRKELVKKLNEYRADIGFLSDTFVDSERTTKVEIALIYVDIPMIQYDFDVFSKMHRAQEYKSQYESMTNNYQLAVNDVIKIILDQYNKECTIGLSLLDNYNRFVNILPRSSHSESPLINMTVLTKENSSNYSIQNLYLRELRAKYWNIFFKSDDVSKYLTENTRAYFQRNMEKLRNYDFNLDNIKTMQIYLVESINSNLEVAIMEQFDKLTYEHSQMKSGNIHYYNSWCTNKAYKINKKIIIPCYGIYENVFGWSLYKATDMLDEIEKVLTYLNGGYREGETIGTILRNISRNGYDGEKVHGAFFDAKFMKKGTIHIWFTNEDLLKKWNIFAGRKKGFLPDDYGTKQYKDLDNDNKQLVEEFEGISSYSDTVSNSNYYLENKVMLGLTTTE